MMSLRIRSLLTAAAITTLASTAFTLALYFFTGGRSFYEAGRFLLMAGISLAVLVVPLFYRSHHRARIHIHLEAPVEERNRIISDPYYDYFAGATLGLGLTIILSVGILALSGNLEGRQSSSANVPFVGSVKAELPNLYEQAREWQSDAFLVELTYYFGRKSEFHDQIISAEFRSFAQPDTLLIVEVTTTGEYNKQFFHDLQPIENRQAPASDENWTIDSQEAVTIFGQDNSIRPCLNYDREKTLKLTQGYAEDQHARWCLRIDACAELDSTTCIDAVTGEPISLVK